MSIQGRISKLEEGIPAQGCARCDGSGRLQLSFVRAIIDASDSGVDPPHVEGCERCSWLEKELEALS